MKKEVNFASDLEQVFSFEYVHDDNTRKQSVDSSHEAVVYLLETNKHVEDDSEESARGLEKRTEQGAWELYEIQRDGRNAVLGEQEDIQRERVKDADAAALRIARAYSAVTEKPIQAAQAVALKDKEIVEKYHAEETKTRKAQLRQKRVKSEKLSPLKSPARSTVVPWGRKVSMPLMDTRDAVEIKERVDSAPIEKGVMEDAAAKALSARKMDKQTESSEEKSKKKTKRKKSVKVSKKTASVEKTSSHKVLDKLEAQKLKDEICELEKRLARKQAAKAKQIAEQMSLGFKETKPKERKNTKKKSPKSPIPRSTPVRKLSKRQLSWSEKSALANMDPVLALKPVDPLSMSLSDVSTCVMTSSELSSSSFDVDGSFSSLGGFIDSSLEPDPSAECCILQEELPSVESQEEKLPMFSRLRRQNRKSSRSKKAKEVNAPSHFGAESSCHF